MPIRITNNKIIFNDNTELTTAPSVQAAFPSGTIAIFHQTNAPTGWTKITTYNNYALRVVSGTVTTYSGMLFTSVFTTRYPSGSVSVSVSDHTGGSTSSSSSGISISGATVSGSYSGTTGSSTVNISGTTGSASGSGSTDNSSVTMSGSTSSSSCGFEDHSHTYNYVSGLSKSYSAAYTQSGGDTPVSYVTDVYLSLSSGNTGSSGGGSAHSHSVSFTGGSHSHNFSVPSHSHSFSGTSASHSHSYSGSFTSDSHTHSVTDNGHSHSLPNLTHSASASFNGNAMDFSINYIDVILASKD